MPQQIPHVFDLSQEPCELAPYRWNRHRRRDPSKFAGVVLHEWGTRVGTEQRFRLRYGEPLALARRALAAPYTISCGVTRADEPVVALAHPLERYTFSSDAGNSYWISVGVMGLFPFEAAQQDPRRHSEMTDGLRSAIAGALQLAAEWLSLCAPGPSSVITHRQCANGPGDHVVCPGEAVVEAACAALPPSLTADPDRLLLPEFGRPWPASWRRHLPSAVVTDQRVTDDVPPPPHPVVMALE